MILVRFDFGWRVSCDRDVLAYIHGESVSPACHFVSDLHSQSCPVPSRPLLGFDWKSRVMPKLFTEEWLGV